MNSIVIKIVAFSAFLVLSTSSVFASGVYDQYGGVAEPGNIVIDKQVRHPISGDYVDNLDLSEPKYSANSIIFFRISLYNRGKATIPKVTVEDSLPPYLIFVSGGRYDSKKRTVLISFDNLAPEERRSTIVQAKIVSTAQLPNGKRFICATNIASIYISAGGKKNDSAQFCIQNIPVAKSVPETGDPFGLALALGSIPTLYAGWKLRRRK